MDAWNIHHNIILNKMKPDLIHPDGSIEGNKDIASCDHMIQIQFINIKVTQLKQ